MNFNMATKRGARAREEEEEEEIEELQDDLDDDENGDKQPPDPLGQSLTSIEWLPRISVGVG